jgi:RNA polymerase sigma factor (sigma-70 family)
MAAMRSLDRDEGRDRRWALLSRHREPVLLALRRRFGDFPDAEDVVDEAMLRLVDLPDLEHQRVAALLYTAAHHLNIDRHRRGARLRRVTARLEVQRSVAPDDLAVARDELRQALHCVSTLSAKEQQALAGRVLGYRPAETAELLGVSTTSVYQALSRARTALRAALGGAALLGLWLRRIPAGLRVAAASAPAATVSAAVVLAVAHPWAGQAPAPRAGGAAVTAPAAVAHAGPTQQRTAPPQVPPVLAGGTPAVPRPRAGGQSQGPSAPTVSIAVPGGSGNASPLSFAPPVLPSLTAPLPAAGQQLTGGIKLP